MTAAARIGITVVLCLVLTSTVAASRRGKAATVRAKPFTASAYCLSGKTHTGVRTGKGMIAADPRVLPLGSIVRIYSATRPPARDLYRG